MYEVSLGKWSNGNVGGMLDLRVVTLLNVMFVLVSWGGRGCGVACVYMCFVVVRNCGSVFQKARASLLLISSCIAQCT